jgi:predicted XRE-type DNA-binding protein
MPTKIEDSTGNVFKDLGFPPEDAENLKIRSELMIHVLQVLESRGLN